ncbi:MAG: RHS repeat-associated core domain-containing protein [Clostridia bacterium]|nr:RHS repeat-associated core domain-containing protein [Clostridia bacterium]MBR1718181.1 RHS repeat-associated core domain-containing protein [Bacilli bacterium]
MILSYIQISFIDGQICSNFSTNSTFFFNGKEKDYESGFHYYGSRYYSSEISMWLSTDPMADKYPSLSPYNYCANNPIKLIDPNGEEIWVAKQDNGTYKITNGIQNKDKGIYLINSDGSRSNNKIGQALTEYSFFNDKNEVVKDAILNPNDNSGKRFIDNIDKSSINVVEYALNAGNEGKYDFKHLGYSEDNGERIVHYNRGMKLDGIKGVEGTNVYGSARDVGNYVAGMVSAKNGLSWLHTRMAFDAYQSYKSKGLNIEAPVSQLAQYLGFKSYGGNWNYLAPVSTFKIFSNSFKRLIK